jgi:hypothetical protein
LLYLIVYAVLCNLEFKKDSKRRAAELLLKKLKEKRQPCQVADVVKIKASPSRQLTEFREQIAAPGS